MGLLHHVMVNVIPSSSANATVSFPGMDPTEEFRFYFMQHWLRLARVIGFLVVWMLIFVAVVYTSDPVDIEDETTRRVMAIILCTLFIAPHFVFLSRLYKYFLYIIVVTNKKIHVFKRTLVTVDRHETADLWVLQDIHKIQRGIFQNMLGFGSLDLAASDSHVIVHFTPHIDKVYNEIVHLRELTRQQAPSSIQNHIEDAILKQTNGSLGA